VWKQGVAGDARSTDFWLFLQGPKIQELFPDKTLNAKVTFGIQLWTLL
jgi:hypothetical protein